MTPNCAADDKSCHLQAKSQCSYYVYEKIAFNFSVLQLEYNRSSTNKFSFQFGYILNNMSSISKKKLTCFLQYREKKLINKGENRAYEKSKLGRCAV